MTDSSTSIRAVVADDERFILQILVKMLERLGIEVVGMAANGEECVNLYQVHKPDLVVLDIAMPVMDGLQALEEIRRLDPDANVLMCTSFSSRQYITEAERLGAKGYLSKPFDLDKIRAKVSGICELPTPSTP